MGKEGGFLGWKRWFPGHKSFLGEESYCSLKKCFFGWKGGFLGSKGTVLEGQVSSCGSRCIFGGKDVFLGREGYVSGGRCILGGRKVWFIVRQISFVFFGIIRVLGGELDFEGGKAGFYQGWVFGVRKRGFSQGKFFGGEAFFWWAEMALFGGAGVFLWA